MLTYQYMSYSVTTEIQVVHLGMNLTLSIVLLDKIGVHGRVLL